MATIALLLALLLPSLRAARQQAQRVVCGTRLKQWGLAFDCYATEGAGVYPHCDGLDRGPDDPSSPWITSADLADWHGWVDVLPRLLDRKPFREHARYDKPNQSTFFQCSLGVPLEDPRLYSYRPLRDGYFSYAMNSCLELDENAWPPPDNAGYPMPSFLKTSRITTPQRTILLFEQLLDPRKGFDGNIVYRGAGKHCGTYPKSFSARHPRSQEGLGGNLLFCDGHVEWRTKVWKDDWDEDQQVPPRDDPEWYPYAAPEDHDP